MIIHENRIHQNPSESVALHPSPCPLPRVTLLRPASVFACSVNAVFGWFAGFGILNRVRPVFTGSLVRPIVHEQCSSVCVFVEHCYKSNSVQTTFAELPASSGNPAPQNLLESNPLNSRCSVCGSAACGGEGAAGALARPLQAAG